MKKRLIKFFCCLIPFKVPRHRLRKLLESLSRGGVRAWQEFRTQPVRSHSVLVIEPNDCHGEVVSGFVKYFLDLGYDVDVFLHESVFQDQPLSWAAQKGVRVWGFSHHIFKGIGLKKQIQAYERILLTSSAYYFWAENKVYPASVDVLALRDDPRLLVVEHELRDIERFREEPLLRAGHLITLGTFEQGIMVNPHYFGDFPKHQKNKVCHFIAVGGISAVRKNHQLLFDAVEKLVQNGYKSFKVTIVGRGKKVNIPENIRSFFDVTGYLDFPNMFQHMQKADFFLPLLDPDQEAHERYIKSGVTGSAQLIYGFLTPPLVSEKFAAFYGFNAKNSVLYEGNELAAAMSEAIGMKAQNYDQKQQELSYLVSQIEQKSQKNLQRAIHA